MQKGIKTIYDLPSFGLTYYDPTVEMQKGIKTLFRQKKKSLLPI